MKFIFLFCLLTLLMLCYTMRNCTHFAVYTSTSCLPWTHNIFTDASRQLSSHHHLYFPLFSFLYENQTPHIPNPISYHKVNLYATRAMFYFIFTNGFYVEAGATTWKTGWCWRRWDCLMPQLKATNEYFHVRTERVHEVDSQWEKKVWILPSLPKPGKPRIPLNKSLREGGFWKEIFYEEDAGECV